MDKCVWSEWEYFEVNGKMSFIVTHVFFENTSYIPIMSYFQRVQGSGCRHLWGRGRIILPAIPCSMALLLYQTLTTCLRPEDHFKSEKMQQWACEHGVPTHSVPHLLAATIRTLERPQMPQKRLSLVGDTWKAEELGLQQGIPKSGNQGIDTWWLTTAPRVPRGICISSSHNFRCHWTRRVPHFLMRVV